MDGSSKTIYDLNLVELRTILSKRGLNKFGVRPALIERLRASLVEEGKSPETYNFNDCPELSRECENQSKKPSDTGKSKVAVEVKKDVPDVKAQAENRNNDNDVEMKEDVNGIKSSEIKTTPEKKDDEIVSEKVESNSQESEDISEETETNSLKKESDETKIEDMSMEDEDNGSMLLDLEPTKGDIEGYDEMEDVKVESSDAIKQESTPKTTDEKDEEKEEKSEGKTSPGFKIQNLKKNITSAEVKRLVSTNGELSTVDIVSTDDDSSEAVVTLKMESDLEKCLKNLNNIEVDGRMITVTAVGGNPTTVEKPVLADQNKTNRNLWISNLLISTKAQDLKQLLSKYGKVNGVKIVQNPKFPKHLCFGYVTMESNAEAEKCIKKLHKTVFNGKTIHIATTKKDINAAPAAAKKRPQVAKETKEQVVVKKKVDNLPPKRQRKRPPVIRRQPAPAATAKPTRTPEERYLLEKARREERELRDIKRRNIEESKRLESMRSALKKERELLARDRLEFMRLQLEQEKIERDRLVREKNELRRRQMKMKLLEEARQANKRSDSPSPRREQVKVPVRERRSREYMEEERPSKELKRHEDYVPKQRHEEYPPPKRHEEYLSKRREEYSPKHHDEYPSKHREEYPSKHHEGPPSLMRSSKPSFSERPQPLMRADPVHHPEPPRFSKLYAERKEYRPSREEIMRKTAPNSPPSKLDYRFEKEVRYPEPKREDMRFGTLWQPEMQNKTLASSSSSKVMWDNSWKSGWNSQGSGQQHAGNNMGPTGTPGMSYIPPPGINSFVMDRYDSYKPMNTRKY